MNERIRELAQEAEAYADYYAIIADELEKNIFIRRFAELIVRECSIIADEFADEHLRVLPSTRIKQHFGVNDEPR